MPGINEVAQLAGVSTATVSRALSGNGHVSDATRQRVHEAALELGYVVSSNASSLATGRTKNVGVVIPFLNRWFFGAVLEGAEQALLGHGYDLTLYNLSGGGDERRSVFEHFLLRKRVDAVIAISLELTADEVSRLHELGKPVVGVGGPLPGVRTLSVDDVAVARLATEHLISLGHTRIGHIGGNPYFEMDFHLPTNRRVGYEAALRDAGIEPDPDLFAGPTSRMQGGYAAAKRLLGLPARPADRDLRGIRRDGDRRDPRRPRPRSARARRPLGDRHRRPRARRVLRADHGRAVPRAAGPDGGGHPHGRAQPGPSRAGAAEHAAALRADCALEHGPAGRLTPADRAYPGTMRVAAAPA